MKEKDFPVVKILLFLYIHNKFEDIYINFVN
jgi:hypothetical protein